MSIRVNPSLQFSKKKRVYVMNDIEIWKKLIGSPTNYVFDKALELVEKFYCDEFDCELYLQANGIRPDGKITYQRVIMAFPKKIEGKLPGVVVPFYFPEAALGFDPQTRTSLPEFEANPTMLEIVKHGYIAISADSYHLNYAESSLKRSDFGRWKQISEIFNSEHPEWSGIGKLVADTQLLIDVLESDMRVNSDSIGIAGHSLGGKTAFYTGCLDERVKAIMTSDFGVKWEQTNWSDPWYWGEKLNLVKECGLDNAMLLAAVYPKPFCLLAGEADNDDSEKILYSIREYQKCQERLLVVNHRTGHRPPKYAAEAGYSFLDYWLKRHN